MSSTVARTRWKTRQTPLPAPPAAATRRRARNGPAHCLRGRWPPEQPYRPARSAPRPSAYGARHRRCGRRATRGAQRQSAASRCCDRSAAPPPAAATPASAHRCQCPAPPEPPAAASRLRPAQAHPACGGLQPGAAGSAPWSRPRAASAWAARRSRPAHAPG